MIAALFDCDGTLYTAQFGRGLMQYAAEHGRRLSALAYYGSVMPRYLLYKLNLLGDEAFLRPTIANLAWLIKGLDEAASQAVFDWVVFEYLLPTVRSDVATRLRQHQAQEHVVVLVSGSLIPGLRRVADHLGAVGVVGTQVEVRAGRYTGRIIPPVIIGKDKNHVTQAFFAERGIEVDWQSSYAYADSITDMGLFTLVGHPVAVYPEPKLRRYALAHNWEMIGDPA